MTEKEPGASVLHPIQVVSRRTGLSPDVLRAWEKRYQAIMPTRSRGSRRLYTDADVHRLQLLRKATRTGRSISQVARMSTGELETILAADTEPAPPASVSPVLDSAPVGLAPRDHLEDCLRAVEDLDAASLQTAISRAAVGLPRIQLMQEVLLPMMRRIGDAWRAGTLRIAHEHLASAAVRSELGLLLSAQDAPANAPGLVAATPSGQAHELGALVAAVTATSQGWRTSYLGASLPAEEIAAAARVTRSDVVALSIIHPPDDPRLHEELHRLRRLLPGGTELILGGASAPAYERTWKTIDATHLEGMDQLASTLEHLRLTSDPGESR